MTSESVSVSCWFVSCPQHGRTRSHMCQVTGQHSLQRNAVIHPDCSHRITKPRGGRSDVTLHRTKHGTNSRLVTFSTRPDRHPKSTSRPWKSKQTERRVIGTPLSWTPPTLSAALTFRTPAAVCLFYTPATFPTRVLTVCFDRTTLSGAVKQCRFTAALT